MRVVESILMRVAKGEGYTNAGGEEYTNAGGKGSWSYTQYTNAGGEG